LPGSWATSQNRSVKRRHWKALHKEQTRVSRAAAPSVIITGAPDIGCWSWSNIKSWQHRPSRAHVHGSVGGSNRSCLTMASKLFHGQFHGKWHHKHSQHQKLPCICRAPPAEMRTWMHASTLAWERTSVRPSVRQSKRPSEQLERECARACERANVRACARANVRA
jgi:hypothetical protein